MESICVRTSIITIFLRGLMDICRMRQLVLSFVWWDMSSWTVWRTSSRRDCFLRIHSYLLIYCMINPQILIDWNLRPPLCGTLLRFNHAHFIRNFKSCHCELWRIIILYRFWLLLFALGYWVQRLLFLSLWGHFFSFDNQLYFPIFAGWVFIRRINSTYILRCILRVIIMFLDLA